MSLDIAALFVEDNGTATLTLTTSEALVEYGDWKVTRSDRTGVSTVRTFADQDIVGGALVITDHELALSGLVTYTLTIGDESATASIDVETARTWLTFPVLPQYNVELPTVGGYDANHTPRDVYVEPIDGNYAIPIFGPFGKRSGRFGIVAKDYGAALNIVKAYARIRVALLRVPDPVHTSMYHAITGSRISRMQARSDEHLIELEYREVMSPEGSLLGTLAWTFADTTALGETFAETSVRFPTFVDRSIGVV